jgi:hypothetical protein
VHFYKLGLPNAAIKLKDHNKVKMPTTLIVCEKAYEISQAEEEIMKFIEETKAIQEGDVIHITANIFDEHTFEYVRQLLFKNNYSFKEPPKVTSGVACDYMEKELVDDLKLLTPEEFNRAYRIVHYLKIYPLRKLMAAFYACKIFFNNTLNSYQDKKKELGIQGEMSFADSKSYRERFPFMN